MRRTVLAGGLVAAALVAGCSSSGSGSASTSTTAAATATSAAPGTTRAAATTFCGAVEQELSVLRSDFVTKPDQAKAFLASMRRIQAVAPSDLQEPITRMVSAIDKVVASGSGGTTATTATGGSTPSNDALDAVFSEDTAAAAAAFEDRVKKDCNIDLSASGSGSSGSTGTTQPLDYSTSTSEGASATPTLDDLKAAMKAAPGSDAWYPALNGWGIGKLNDAADITLSADSTDRPLDPAGAVAACEAAAAWANGKYASATVTINGPEQKVLASKSGTAACQPG